MLPSLLIVQKTLPLVSGTLQAPSGTASGMMEASNPRRSNQALLVKPSPYSTPVILVPYSRDKPSESSQDTPTESTTVHPPQESTMVHPPQESTTVHLPQEPTPCKTVDSLWRSQQNPRNLPGIYVSNAARSYTGHACRILW